MHRLIFAVMLLAPLAARSQGGSTGSVSGLDLGSGRIVSISGTDLGSGRIVARFLISRQQLDVLLRHPKASTAIEQVGANHVQAGAGYTLQGTPVRDGVADCTRPTTSCYLVPDDEDDDILVLTQAVSDE